MRFRILLAVSTLSAGLVLARGPQESSSNAQQTVTTAGGTAHAIPEFSSSHIIGNSAIYQTAGKVGIGTISPSSTLTVNGVIQSTSGGIIFPDGTTQATAGISNPGGLSSTAVGSGAMPNNTGANNTAIGASALSLNTTAANGTAVGTLALSSNSSGQGNTAVGVAALTSNTIGTYNLAVGYNALYSNNVGEDNTALGVFALQFNTTGLSNTAISESALRDNMSGSYNVAVGELALSSNNTSGSQNTAIGQAALENSSGSENIGIGGLAGYSLITGDRNIYIGNQGGDSSENGMIRIGDNSLQTATYMAGISGSIISSGTNVVVNANGQLGTLPSSRRYKEAIKDMGNSSTALMRLRPVSFRYKNQPDGKEYGLIAEEVADVYPEAVVYRDGEPDAVQYHKINALLLNEVQKQHARIESLERDLAGLKALVTRQSK